MVHHRMENYRAGPVKLITRAQQSILRCEMFVLAPDGGMRERRGEETLTHEKNESQLTHPYVANVGVGV